MEFKHIEYFIEASKHTSISKAAEALYITQQALSRCIQNLEAELGCKLFTRTVKGSKLTDEGRLLRDKFLPIIDSFCKAKEDVFDRLNTKPKVVSFAAAPMVFQALGTMLLYSYKEDNPDVELNVTEMSDADVDHYVKASPKNLGLLAIPRHRHGQRFKFTEIKTYPLCICVHKDSSIAKMDSVTFDRLKDETFLLLDKRSHQRKVVAELCKKYGYEPKVGFTSADINLLLGLVNNNKGVLLAVNDPAFSAVFKDVAFIPVADPEATYSVSFIYRDYESLSRANKRFIDYIKKHAVEGSNP